jgi:manganese transport protein
VVAVTGERGTEKLLILSQVILVLQLSFAVVPLVLFTGSRKEDGRVCEWPLAARAGVVHRGVIAGLNAWLLVETAMGR